MAYFKIEGTDELRDLARRLKEAGATEIQRGVVKGIRKSTSEAVDDTRKAVRGLPIEGGGTGGRGGAARARAAHATARSKKRTEALLRRARSRSGLRETIARATTSQINVSSSTARVRVRVRKAAMPDSQRTLPHRLNKGHWRHPVFGNRDVWAEQTSRAGWFDQTLRAHGDAVREAIRQHIKDALDQI